MQKSLAKYFMYIGLTMILVGVDQWSKQIAYANLLHQPPIDVLPILQWVLVFNRGAAFGFLSQAGGIQYYILSGIAVMVSIVLLILLWRSYTHKRFLSLGLAMVLAGAIGNLIDRVMYRYVIDFIHFHYQDWYFPAFNIADSAITLGAICLIADSLGWVGRDQKMPPQ